MVHWYKPCVFCSSDPHHHVASHIPLWQNRPTRPETLTTYRAANWEAQNEITLDSYNRIYICIFIHIYIHTYIYWGLPWPLCLWRLGATS